MMDGGGEYLFCFHQIFIYGKMYNMHKTRKYHSTNTCLIVSSKLENVSQGVSTISLNIHNVLERLREVHKMSCVGASSRRYRVS